MVLVKHVSFNDGNFLIDFHITSNSNLTSVYVSICSVGIVKYMRAQVGPASKDILTVEAFETFLKVQEASIVGFFEKESELKSVFFKFADKKREKHRFGHSSDPSVLSKVGET
jgi:hypothetical protein